MYKPRQAITLLASRPGVLAVIVSQEVLEAVVLKGTESECRACLLHWVGGQMKISDAFHRFELALSDLEALGQGRERILLFSDTASTVRGAERRYYFRGLLLLPEGYASWAEAVLRDLLQKRNHSMLAHGLEPIEKESTVRSLEYVDELVRTPEAWVGAGQARLGGS